MTHTPRRTRGITLGRAFGGRIVVQPATLLMLVLLAYLFSTRGGNELDRRTFTEGLLLALLLFASVFIHELAHAAAAKRLGRDVHEVVLTLWGGHTSFDGRAMTPAVSGITALAGPLANVALAGIGVVISLALDRNVFELLGAQALGDMLVGYLIYANVILAAFNALPGIPMDGGRVLEAVVWHVTGNRYRGLIVAAWGGRVIAIGVIVAIVGVPLLQGMSPDLFSVMVGVLLFYVLWPAASAALRGAHAMNRREGVTAGSLMVPAVAITFDATVAQAHLQAHDKGAREVVVLAGDGTPAGHFPVTLMDAVPSESRATTSLQSVTMPLPRGAVVSVELTGDALIEQLQQWWGQTDVWVVEDGGTVVGVVELAHVMQALQ